MNPARKLCPLSLWAFPIALISILLPSLVPNAHSDEPARPKIPKLGTLDLDMVETTPVAFRDRLYRFEYVRPGYQANKTGDSSFRFIDVETGRATPAFAQTFDLGCAFADGESMWVFGVDNWDGENIFVFRSNDVDLCEFRGKTIITYSWGNQQGTEFLAEAVYDGSLASFLKSFFPQSDQGKSLPIPGEVFRVVGHTAFLILPKEKKETEAMPWVWYAPTLPGLPGPEEKWMFQKFLDAGMAIAGIDAGESFGSPSGRAIYSSFHEELVQRRGLSKKPCLYQIRWATFPPGRH